MKKYYKKELEKPLSTFIQNKTETIAIRVIAGDSNTKIMNINLESIEPIREALDKIEIHLLEQRK